MAYGVSLFFFFFINPLIGNDIVLFIRLSGPHGYGISLKNRDIATKKLQGIK